MGNRRTEAARLIAAMDGMALRGKEDRVRHRSVVPFPGEVVLLHSERAKRSTGGVVARTARRDFPIVTGLSIHPDHHSLRGFIDRNEKVGGSRPGAHEEAETRSK